MKAIFAALFLGVVIPASLGCPSGINPCTCREVMAGVSIDCTAATSSSAIATAFGKDWPDPTFDFFQIVPLNGKHALEALADGMFADKQFLHCWIGDSNIAKVGENAFSGMKDTILEILLGKSMSLKEFPFKAFEDYTMLYKIQVIGSAISSITSFGAAPQLSEVNFPNSDITTIEVGAFKDLPRLTHVDLSHGKLESVEEGWFTSSTTVDWAVYLSDNKIATISPKAFSGTLPISLYLENNQLTTLAEETFKPILDNISASSQKIKGHIDVSGNPLVCDCSIQWLATEPKYLSSVIGAKCSNDDVAGTPIGELPDDFFSGC